MISNQSLEQSIYVGLAHDPDQGVEPVGLMKLTRHGVLESGEFAYGQRYLKKIHAQPLNPDYLPLQEATFTLGERRFRDGGAIPLTLKDALPDSWGRKVLEIRHGRSLSDVEALLLTNEDRIGAMFFSESLKFEYPVETIPPLTLDELADASRRIEAGLEIDPHMNQLLRGGSLGGARPKAPFVLEGRRYIAKFAARGDDHDVELLEATTLSLALACGITVPRTVVLPVSTGHALLVERFDRDGPISNEQRFHYLSASALLDAPYESSKGSYVELAQTLRRISSRPVQDLEELFRRLIFNLSAGNSDDHGKNHGVLHQGSGFWKLAPAFDLVMQWGGQTGYQSMAISPGRFESSLALAKASAAYFGLSTTRANEIIEFIENIVVGSTYLYAQASGGDRKFCLRAKAFAEEQAQRIRR